MCASVYILLLLLFIPFAFSNFILNFANHKPNEAEGISVVEFPHYQVRYAGLFNTSNLLDIVMTT